MKTTKSVSNLPVSRSSYTRFICYINTVFADDPNRGRIVKALDHYLDGDREFYLDRLPREYRMAFQMLIFEIEAAIDRSAKARERNRLRKQQSENHEPKVEGVVTTDCESTDEAVMAAETTSTQEKLSSPQGKPSKLQNKSFGQRMKEKYKTRKIKPRVSRRLGIG